MNAPIKFAAGSITTAQLGNPEDTNGCYMNADIILLGKKANYTSFDIGFVGAYKDENGVLCILDSVTLLPHSEFVKDTTGLMYCTSARSLDQIREFTRNPEELRWIEEAIQYHRKAVDALPNSVRTPNLNWGKRAL